MNDELKALYIKLNEAREKRDDPSLDARSRLFWGRVVVEIQNKIAEVFLTEPKS